MRRSGPTLSDQRIEGTQHGRLAALIAEHREALAEFIPA
jgi:hypothetical protein